MRRPATIALLATIVSFAAAPPAARADGDPASDVLLGQDVFYPYPPNTPSVAVREALDGMVKRAKARGYAPKIAIIALGSDLGSYPYLLTEPQRYADLLAREISFNTKPRVLVVLPTGLGGQNLGAHAGEALSGVQPDAKADGDALARTAMVALGKLTAAAGTPVAVPPVATASGSGKGEGGKGGGTSPALIFGLPVLLVLGGAAIAAWLGRRQSGEDEEEEDAESQARTQRT